MAPEPLGVVGAGWVGLVTAASFAELGHDVVVRDVDPERVAALEAGDGPIHEPGLAEAVTRNRERIRFTLDLGELLGSAGPSSFASGRRRPTRATPTSRPSGRSSTSSPSQVAAPPDHEGTVPVGTGERVRPASSARPAHVGYVSNPEFSPRAPRSRTSWSPTGSWSRLRPGRRRPRCRAYEPLDAPIVRTDVASSEMIKLASNAAS